MLMLEKAFMDFIEGHPVFDHWVPAFTVLLGTGCRCGEFIGLRWEDIDMENRMISINHALVRAKKSRFNNRFFLLKNRKLESHFFVFKCIDARFAILDNIFR